MKYRLGLDLGTNSLGWTALKLDGDNRPVDVLASGVRLLTPNQEAGRDPQSNVSLAADRRAARAMRRRRDRFLRRQDRLMRALVDAGLMPADEAARKALESRDPYTLRADALDRPLDAYELGRALFHINQRRGFKSNRIADSDDTEAGATKDGMRNLEEALAAENARTLGEFLARRHAAREPVRFRPQSQGTKNIYDFYPSREMTERELDAIWSFQHPHHSQLTDELLGKLKHIIVAQRPLKKPLVGKCTFRPDEDRAPRALPIFQRYRILTDLGNLMIERPGAAARRLRCAERDALANKLMTQASTVSFESMRNALKLHEDARFNYEGGNRKGFEPDQTAKVLAHKNRFGKAWRGMNRDRQSEIVDMLLTEPDEDVLGAWLEGECGLDAKAARLVSSARLPQGHGHLGRSMLADMVDALENESVEAVDPETGEVYRAPLTYDQAVEAVQGKHADFRPAKQLPRLPYYGKVMERHVIPTPDAPTGSQEAIGKLPNPTVHIALNQVRRLINALIDEYGPPHEIVVELARELKWTQKRKDEHNRTIKKNTDANERRVAKLKELGQIDNGENRLRLKLYEELPADERVCVYSGKSIAVEDLFSGAVEIDHILPFSTTLDDSFLNKVLCTREANRRKGARSPADAFSPDDLQEVAERAGRILDRRKAKRFAPDAMEKLAGETNWQARHLTDTQHMARLTKEYLGHICDPNRVWAIPGHMTAMLRGLWGLNSLLGDHNRKDRNDHRHHAVDAFVVACTDRALLQRAATAAGRTEKLEADRLFADGVPEPFPDFRATLARSLEALIVSHKLDHGVEGQLHEDTAYGLVNEEIDGKRFNLVTRKSISSLTAKEVSQVRDTDLRAQLMAVAEQAASSGAKLDQALAAFGKKWNIRRVRVLKTESSIITVRHGNGFEKALVPGAVHRMEVFCLPDGQWDFEAVTVFDANQTGYAPAWQRKNPDASLVMRLHKGDTLEADLRGKPEYWVVYRLNPASNRIWVAPHMDAGDQSSRAWQRPTIKKLQAVGAKLVRVDMLGRIKKQTTAA